MNYRLVYNSDHTVTFPTTVYMNLDFPIDEEKAKVIRAITIANVLRAKKKPT